MLERSPEKPSSPTSQPSRDGAESSNLSERASSPLPPSAQDKKTTNPPLSAEEKPSAPSGDAPPLPDEPPPLPNEAAPTEPVDDGWAPVWDDQAQAFYFYNRLTNATQWENPRVPESTRAVGPPGVGNHDRPENLTARTATAAGGYNPAIHGDYDPDADYAKTPSYSNPSHSDVSSVAPGAPGTDSAGVYAATGAFNRFTGKWQNADFTPERFNDESKSKRQMNAFFDVDAAANSHDGRSLRAERANKKLSKHELKAFKEKRREKKEEKRRAWLRD
jgi:WW domain